MKTLKCGSKTIKWSLLLLASLLLQSCQTYSVKDGISTAAVTTVAYVTGGPIAAIAVAGTDVFAEIALDKPEENTADVLEKLKPEERLAAVKSKDFYDFLRDFGLWVFLPIGLLWTMRSPIDHLVNGVKRMKQK